MGTKRLFGAVALPPAQSTELEDFLDASGIDDAGVRMVSPDRWHITLSFMPAVGSEQVEAVHDELVALASRTAPLDLVLRHAGTIARSGAATPIWMGVDGDVAALGALAAGCRRAAHRTMVRVETSKHFRPHVTLSRHMPVRHGDLWLERLDRFRGTPWTVTEMLLIESTLGAQKGTPRYSVIGRHALTG